MSGYMLDTTVFNHLVEGCIALQRVPSDQLIYVTHVQLNEIQRTPDAVKLQSLLAVFTAIDSAQIPTSSAIWNISEYGNAEYGTPDGLFQSLLANLNGRNKSKKNNAKDILIAETAIRHNLILVTDDHDLSDVVCEAGGNAIGLSQFLTVT